MTHGHELKGENVGRGWFAGQRRIKGGKWDNCNSIIYKIYLKKKVTGKPGTSNGFQIKSL